MVCKSHAFDRFLQLGLTFFCARWAPCVHEMSDKEYLLSRLVCRDFGGDLSLSIDIERRIYPYMSVTIDYEFVPGFPKLGWLAQYDLRKRTIKVLHGSSVECKEQWMVEGVWDGDFELGEFHRSECFFGSGIRIENGDVYFVASSAMTDRLFLVEYSGLITVSNSLILMLAYTGAALDPNHDYRNETMSILGGVSKYTRQFKVTHPEISDFQQVFYENIVISDGLIRFETRTKRIKIRLLRGVLWSAPRMPLSDRGKLH